MIGVKLIELEVIGLKMIELEVIRLEVIVTKPCSFILVIKRKPRRLQNYIFNISCK